MESSLDGRQQTGFYCSTSGTYFTDKDELADHYKSDFHRYNLKRKVAGLPPVTRDWFEARKAQLGSGTTAAADLAGAQRSWFDPLTRKKFASENTYQAHVRSKKYQDLVKRSGQPAPEPVVMRREVPPPQQPQQPVQQQAAPAAAAVAAERPAAGYTIQPPSVAFLAPSAVAVARPMEVDAKRKAKAAVGPEDEDDQGSDWETASNVSETTPEDPADWQPWDVKVSLFDSHTSDTMEANLEYMWRKFGFYLPDAQYLKDPEGLLKYLGAKLQYGRVALYTRGDDDNAHQFRSLHAVQRHMVDTNQCKMTFEGAEEEYADFYDYEEGATAMDEDAAEGASGKLAVVDPGASAAEGNGYELAVPAAAGAGGAKLLGHREFARYYKQRPAPAARNASAIAVAARYKALGVASAQSLGVVEARRKAQHMRSRAARFKLTLYMKSNVIRNLPKNVPY